MCGIFGTKSYKKLIKKYNKQRARGSEGFGILNVAKNGKVEVIRETDEQKFINQLSKLKDKGGKFCFVHHRFPTSTKNYKSQTHPIKVENKSLEFDYYVLHNGVISNTNELKDHHDKLKFDYSTLLTYKTVMSSFVGKSTSFDYDWNDSNSLAIELARFLEGQIKDLTSVKGSFAFIVIQTTKKGVLNKVFVGRNSGNPLMIDEFGSFGSEIGTSEIVAGKIFELNISNMGLVEVKQFTDNYEKKSYSIGFRTSGMYNSKDWVDDYNDYYKGYTGETAAEKDEKMLDEVTDDSLVWQNYEEMIEDLEEYKDELGKNKEIKNKINTLLDEYVCGGDLKLYKQAEDLMWELEYITTDRKESEDGIVWEEKFRELQAANKDF